MGKVLVSRMLSATDLRKKYGKREVVRGVSMQLEPGKVVGLLGPNGAGKTTCFYMIVGLISCDGGAITVDDVDITHEPVNVRSRLGVGYLPQDASIFRKLSVRDNILAILETLELSDAERQERLETLLTEMRLTHVRKNRGTQLSGAGPCRGPCSEICRIGHAISVP